MKIFRLICIFALAFSFIKADVAQNQKVKNTINILNDFANSDVKDKGLLNDVKAIAILPAVVKAGVLLTASKSKGIFVAKNDDGEWSSPFFVDYTSAGAGFQAGVVSSDLVILFRNSRAYADIFNGTDTISFSVQATSMNAGNTKMVTTDLPEISACIRSEGKSRGVFIGASLDLGRLTINNQDTNDYYGRIYTFEDIYENSPKDTKYTAKLKEILNNNF